MVQKRKPKKIAKYRVHISLKSKVVRGKSKAAEMKKHLQKKLKGAKVTITKA